MSTHKYVCDSPAHRANYNTRLSVTEQPLPPNGACLLGSWNLTKYVEEIPTIGWLFNYNKLRADIAPIVAMMDNVIDYTIYPLSEQRTEALSKRRMGLGVTGVANTAECLGLPYGSPQMIMWCEKVMTIVRDECYKASVELARKKGAFPLFDKEKYLAGTFIRSLPSEIRDGIAEFGIRNSHLLSIAPTGTISLFAGNVSSGIEPPFSLEYNRRTVMPDNSIKEWVVMDYAYDQWGIKGRTSDQLNAKEHVDVLCTFSRLVDSACSKTCNVGDEVTFDEFKDLYLRAYEGGASGCTTFRPASIETRGAVLTAIKEADEGQQCVIDFTTGERSCAD